MKSPTKPNVISLPASGVRTVSDSHPENHMVSICASEQFNPITEAELVNLEIARRCARRSAVIAIQLQIHIEDRLRRGAKVKSCLYYYDVTTGDIVRR
jgi:hypothetical protein